MATSNDIIDIEALVSGKTSHARLQIAIPQTVLGDGESGVISGFTNQSFSLQGSTQWEGKPVGSERDGIVNKATELMNSAGAGFQQGSTTSRQSTNRRWVTSEPAAFQVEFLLVAYREGIDVRKDVGKLFRCVYPSGSRLGTDNVGLGMLAPMGYIPSTFSAENTATLRVGRWFQADGLLVDDVAAEFSREVTNEGFPLYAEVSVSLSPWRMLFGDDMVGFMSRDPNLAGN